MRDRVSAELDVGAVSVSRSNQTNHLANEPSKKGSAREEREKSAYFFIIIYRSAFPMVWSSFRNSKEAAVSVAPGSYT